MLQHSDLNYATFRWYSSPQNNLYVASFQGVTTELLLLNEIANFVNIASIAVLMSNYPRYPRLNILYM